MKNDIFKNNRLIDASLLDAIKKADKGCQHALQELYLAFTDGKGVKADQQKAEEYLRKSIKLFSDDGDDAIKKSWAKSCLIYVKAESDDHEGVETELVDYLRYNIDRIHPVNWNWHIIKILAEYYLQDDEVEDEKEEE